MDLGFIHGHLTLWPSVTQAITVEHGRTLLPSKLADLKLKTHNKKNSNEIQACCDLSNHFAANWPRIGPDLWMVENDKRIVAVQSKIFA